MLARYDHRSNLLDQNLNLDLVVCSKHHLNSVATHVDQLILNYFVHVHHPAKRLELVSFGVTFG